MTFEALDSPRGKPRPNFSTVSFYGYRQFSRKNAPSGERFGKAESPANP